MTQHQVETDQVNADDALNHDPIFSRLSLVEHETVSPEVRELARKNVGTVLRYVHKHGAGRVAADLGISDSAMSRFLSDGRMEFAVMFFARLGLRIVPADATVFIQPEEYR